MLEVVQKTLDRVKQIPGLMTPEELALLCRFARSASSIAELGCYKGRSLAAMGITHPSATLYGIDWFGDMSHRGYQGSTLAETGGNLEKVGVKATFLVGTTDEVAPKFDQKIDLLHVDAGHSYEECMSDLRNYVPKINPGGAVCIHDYGKARKAELDRPEVKQAVDEFFAPHSPSPQPSPEGEGDFPPPQPSNPLTPGPLPEERENQWVEVERSGTMIAFRNLVADEGVLYVAYGEKAIANVENSIRLVKKFAGKLPIAVISDRRVEGADYLIQHIEVDAGARAAKTRVYSLSPFMKTLYLDADTEMQSDPMHGFRMLEHFDIVVAQDPVRIFNQTKWPGLIDDEVKETIRETNGAEFLYYNSGVIFFRRSEANKRLFQTWNAEWTRWARQDQPALFRSMYRNPVRIASMRPPWNTHVKSQADFIFHAHRRASREGAPK
ncbi:MAG TPA: hypothetical protein DDW19_01885 [Anaerolineaceae bacterium]|nr:hypothetical protein [Anaerolineaceae bacterium]